MPPVTLDPSRRGQLRLRRAADFAAVASAPRAQSLRSARHWLAMTAAWSRAESPAVRFGTTVGRRTARRAVDRVLVKRILREAARAAAARLAAAGEAHGVRVDVAFRLKTVRVTGAGAESLRHWRRTLRHEADELLGQLVRHLDSLPTG